MEPTRRALEIFRAEAVPDAVARVMHQLGNLHQRLGENDRALELYEAAIALREEHELPGNGSTLSNMGTV